MKAPRSRIAETLDLKHPLIVAPMAGGISSVALVAAASEAGTLGSVGAAYMTPAAITRHVSEIRNHTNRPIAINLFVPSPTPSFTADEMQRALNATAAYRDELSLTPPKLTAPYSEDFEQQFQTMIELKPEVFSFVFGVPSKNHLDRAKQAGIYTVGTATSIAEALQLESSGVDAFVVQGVEAGGHRGIFDPGAEDPDVTTFDLVTAIAPKVRVPIIAAGGIMNAMDIKRMLTAGADAVQMGTAFLAVKEAGTSEAYRRTLTSPRATKLTRVFSGRLARGIQNRFMREMDSKPDTILPFPAQNEFTRDIRNASAKIGESDFISLWSGTGDGELSTGTTAELIDKLFQ